MTRVLLLMLALLMGCHRQPGPDLTGQAKPGEEQRVMVNCHKARDQALAEDRRKQIARLEAIVPHGDSSAEVREALIRTIADERKRLAQFEQWIELCRDRPDVTF